MQAVTLGKGESWLAEAESRMPWGRLIQPEDVARLTLFLLSDVSIPMTGTLIDQAKQRARSPRIGRQRRTLVPEKAHSSPPESQIKFVSLVSVDNMDNMKFTLLLVAASGLSAFALTAFSDDASDLVALRANSQQAYAEFQSAFTAWENAQKSSNDAALISRTEIAFWQADSRMQDLASQARKLTLSETGPRNGTEPLDTTQARSDVITIASGTNPQQ
jgi:hypothetical protein